MRESSSGGPVETIEFLINKGLARAACSRSSVAALALLPLYGTDWTPIALGWNHPVLERGGLACETDCPRAQASHVVPGVSSYDSGPSSCIALHAEEHALRGVYGYLKGSPFGITDVFLLTTREPCYKCEEMLRLLGVTWALYDMEKPEKVSMPSPS